MRNLTKVLLSLAPVLLFATACGGGGEGGFTIIVDSTADTDARDDGLTLREAILVATGDLQTADLAEAESDNVHGKAGAAHEKPDQGPVEPRTCSAFRRRLRRGRGG